LLASTRNVTEAIDAHDWKKLFEYIDPTGNEEWGVKALLRHTPPGEHEAVSKSMQTQAITKAITDICRIGDTSDNNDSKDNAVMLLGGFIAELMACTLWVGLSDMKDDIFAIQEMLTAASLMHEVPDDRIPALEAAKKQLQTIKNVFFKPLCLFPVGQHLNSKIDAIMEARVATKAWSSDLAAAVVISNSLKFLETVDCVKDGSIVIPAQA
jgi:hypothetical protein